MTASGNVGLFGDDVTQTIDNYTNYTTLTLSNNTGGIIQFEDDGNAIGEIFNGTDNLSIGTTESGASLRFRTDTGTEAMRIDSSGNVGIGTTSPSTKLTVSSGYISQTDGTRTLYMGSDGSGGLFGTITNHYQRFITNNTERMRIDSSGNLLYDCTNVSQQTDDGIKFVSNGRIFTVSGYDSSAQENFSMYSTGASAFRFYVDWGGTIHATSTSISAISDQRLKENIVNLETGLTEVMALKPRRFDWKNGDKINVAGFIAQEVETVLPDLIDGFKNDTIEDAKGVRMGDMIPTLVKAIQEQQTIIDDLKARITTLEGS